jgi:holliday junction DNA helicase RuvA
MISSVRGAVLEVALDHAVVEVGGVGLTIYTTPTTLAGLRRGAEARFATALVVREDALTLYGFADAEARELFSLLQTVNRVGPRLALAMLAVLDPDALCAALADGDIATLTTVPGVGRKVAELLILELRDKVVRVSSPTTGGPVRPASAQRDHVVEALVGLGFVARQAEHAVDEVLAGADGSGGSNGRLDPAATLRAALSTLGRSR